MRVWLHGGSGAWWMNKEVEDGVYRANYYTRPFRAADLHRSGFVEGR